MKNSFTLSAGTLSLTDLRSIYQDKIRHITLSETSQQNIHRAKQYIDNILQTDRVVYGINTGFGLLATTQVAKAELQSLQYNLIRSHAAGVGELLTDDIVRLTLALKINALSQGYSGCSLTLVEHLLAFYNQRIYPCIPSKGSVGASGDLAPLAHMALPLIGESEVRVNDKRLPAKAALTQANLAPLILQPKEGLALINGTEISTAIALCALFKFETIFKAALLAGALSIDAFKASVKPFQPAVHRVRRFLAQQDIASWLSSLLQGSAINQSHTECDRVQDPYSLRCQPQVMGACLHQMRYAANVFLTESNAVNDNPLVFSEEDTIISAGNFHAEPIALAADALATAIAEVGALSERRTALLIDPHLSKLPAYLINDSGLHSGLSATQVTASALVNENKTLAYPASVNSLPTFANQEDHISMATYAALRLHTMIENVATIIGIEMLAACQGIDFHQPLTTSPTLQAIKQQIRQKIPAWEQDHFVAPEIDWIKQEILYGHFNGYLAIELIPENKL